MIIDSLTNIGKYVALNPLFQDVVDYIKNNDLASKTEGKEYLIKDILYVNFNVAKGKTKEEAKIETHNKMIDIQIPLNCAETFGVTPREYLPEQQYNADKDITFYEGLAQQYVTVTPGMFVIFFPHDGHAPCISIENQIQKVIFKVSV